MLQKVISGCLDFRVAIATRRVQTVKFRITSNMDTLFPKRLTSCTTEGFAEGCPQQRPLEEFLAGEGVFAEDPLSGTRQSLRRGPGRPSATKRSRNAPAPLAVSLPRAHPRQRNDFFWICLPRADPRQINFFIFFKNLCRGPPPWLSTKKFSGFFKNSLPRAGPRQRNGFFEIF